MSGVGIACAEIIASAGFGWVMSHLLGNSKMTAVVCGGWLLVLAAVLVQRVRDEPV